MSYELPISLGLKFQVFSLSCPFLILIFLLGLVLILDEHKILHTFCGGAGASAGTGGAGAGRVQMPTLDFNICTRASPHS